MPGPESTVLFTPKIDRGAATLKMASKVLLEKIKAGLTPKFGTVAFVCRNYGMGPSHCQDLIAKKIFRSFVLKETPEAKRGIKLIEIASVEEFFAQQMSEQAKAPPGPSPIMAAARAAKAAKRAAKAPAKSPS